MSIILFILILFILVLVHELGHFAVAKLAKIRVDEFGFGYPPRAAKLFTRGGTLFTLNWLPFGGFVKIFGENPDGENTHGPQAAYSFVHKPKWVQASVLLAGVAMNFILAWVLFSVGFMSGLPTSVGSEPTGATLANEKLVVTNILPGKPADVAGIKPGDEIVSLKTDIDILDRPTPETLKIFIGSHTGQEISFGYLRYGTEAIASVIPETGIIEGTGAIGIGMDMIGTLKLPFFQAFKEGIIVAYSASKEIVLTLGKLLHDSFVGRPDISSLTGPIGIVGAVGDAYQFGLIYLLSFTAIISLNLAVINLIPFPALDGGRLFFIIIESIKGSPVSAKIQNWINILGFGVLILLMLVVTYHDIVRLVVR